MVACLNLRDILPPVKDNLNVTCNTVVLRASLFRVKFRDDSVCVQTLRFSEFLRWMDISS